VCPHCGITLISECPHCNARIKTAFAEYCYACGLSFKKISKNREVNNCDRKVM
jgi:hypothetical protein